MWNDDSVHQALTLLTRIAQRKNARRRWLKQALSGPRLDRLAGVALDVAVETGGATALALAAQLEKEVSPELTIQLWRRCEEEDYQKSVPLLEVALLVTRKTLDIRRASWGEPNIEQQAEIAHLVHNLGIRFADMRRRDEALKVIEEAVNLYRKLIRRRPDDFKANLALGLNNLGARLSELNRLEEALKATREAVGLYRELAEKSVDHGPDLAASLHNLGSQFSELGHLHEALNLFEEAVGLYRTLTASEHSYHSDLAESLNSFGSVLRDSGNWEEARRAIQEAVGLYRQLADFRPDIYRSELGYCLSNFGTILSDLGHREEALEACQEAIQLHREWPRSVPKCFGQILPSFFIISARHAAGNGPLGGSS